MRKLFTILIASILGFSAYSQKNVLLVDHWSNDSILEGPSEVRYNECWGFTQKNKEYAVLGSTEGTHIFQISDNNELEFVDFVAGRFSNPTVVHRDFHEAFGYLYAVCDEGASSLQIMDLNYLPDSVHVVRDTNIITRSHNIFIDKDNALLYVCNPSPQTSSLLVYDLENPIDPEEIPINDQILPDEVHDIYVKDNRLYLFSLYAGLHIYTFDKATATLTKVGDMEFYQDQGECHSGWTTPDGNLLFFTDETNGMRIKVCDVSNLPNTKIINLFGTNYENGSVAHNIMIRGDYAYVSYYNEGLRVYNIADPSNVYEAGHYDTYTQTNSYKLHGAWGIYALLPSGRLIVSDRQNGLFLLDFLGDDTDFTSLSSDGVQIRHSSWNKALYIAIDKDWTLPAKVVITDAMGKLVYQDKNNANNFIKVNTSSLSNGPYIIKIRNDNGRETSKKFIVLQH